MPALAPDAIPIRDRRSVHARGHQHRTKTEKTVNGLDIPANPLWNDGNPVEVYTIAEFWKIK